MWIHGIKLKSLGLSVIASTSEPSFWPKFLYSRSDWGLLFRKGVRSFGWSPEWALDWDPLPAPTQELWSDHLTSYTKKQQWMPLISKEALSVLLGFSFTPTVVAPGNQPLIILYIQSILFLFSWPWHHFPWYPVKAFNVCLLGYSLWLTTKNYLLCYMESLPLEFLAESAGKGSQKDKHLIMHGCSRASCEYCDKKGVLSFSFD